MEKHEISASEFALGFSCSQAVVRAFAADLGLDPDTAARAAAAFGGGVGRTGRMCGAVSGALMVIGLRYGSADPVNKGAKESTYAIARRFLEEFEARFGSVDCPGLLGVHIGSPEGMQQARDLGLFKTRCPEYVQGAARILTEMTEN